MITRINGLNRNLNLTNEGYRSKMCASETRNAGQFSVSFHDETTGLFGSAPENLLACLKYAGVEKYFSRLLFNEGRCYSLNRDTCSRTLFMQSPKTSVFSGVHVYKGADIVVPGEEERVRSSKLSSSIVIQPFIGSLKERTLLQGISNLTHGALRVPKGKAEEEEEVRMIKTYPNEGEPMVLGAFFTNKQILYLPSTGSGAAELWLGYKWQQLMEIIGLEPLEEPVFDWTEAKLLSFHGDDEDLLKDIREDDVVRKPIRVTVGADPEYEVCRKDESEPVPANSIISDRTDRLGVDGEGDQAEIRPTASNKPRSVVADIRNIMGEFQSKHSEFILSVRGDKYPLGGHIHIGVGQSWHPPENLKKMLDDFLGRHTNELTGHGRLDRSYGFLSDARSKLWGFEYRTPSATIFAKPRMAYISMKIAKNLTESFINRRTIEYNSPTPRREDYKRIAGLSDEEYDYFWNFIKEWDTDFGESLVAFWAPKVKEPPRLLGKVRFSDDWANIIKRDFETQVLKMLRELYKKKEDNECPTIEFYGLKQERGLVSSIPVDGWSQEYNLPKAVVYSNRFGGYRIAIGLPFTFRTDEDVFEDKNKEVVEAVKKFLKEFKKEPDKVKQDYNELIHHAEPSQMVESSRSAGVTVVYSYNGINNQNTSLAALGERLPEINTREYQDADVGLVREDEVVLIDGAVVVSEENGIRPTNLGLVRPHIARLEDVNRRTAFDCPYVISLSDDGPNYFVTGSQLRYLNGRENETHNANTNGNVSAMHYE